MAIKLNSLAKGIEPIVEVPVPLLGDTLKVRLISARKMRSIYPDEAETAERHAQMLHACVLDDDGETPMAMDQALRIALEARGINPFEGMSEADVDALTSEEKEALRQTAREAFDRTDEDGEDWPLSRAACTEIISAVASALRGEGDPTGKY